MSWAYAVVWAMTGLFALSAVVALAWAVQHGHMENFSDQARSIFDDDEPVGRPTDATPPEYGRGPDVSRTSEQEGETDDAER